MEYAKLLKEFEVMKGSENDTNEEGEGRGHEWRNKMEEIPSLMKEMIGRSAEQKLKGSPEAAEHDVSQSQRRKKKTDEDQETVEHDLCGRHRSKKKNEEGPENEEKSKKKKERKDERLSQNEKDDERRNRKALKRARKRSRSKEIFEVCEEREMKN